MGKKAKAHLKLKVKKPKVIGKHIKAPKLKISKKISLKKPVLKMKKHKPHMTGTTCGSRPPQYQAACYRSRHQKVPKFALDAEKKAKAHLKLKVKKPKVIGKHTKTPSAKVHVKVHVKPTKPAKHTKVTKVTHKVGDVITTTVYSVEEVITEVIVPVEEIITVQMHRLSTIHTIIADAAKSVKKAKGAKKVKIMKKIKAAKKN